jgi:hypothetical protein
MLHVVPPVPQVTVVAAKAARNSGVGAGGPATSARKSAAAKKPASFGLDPNAEAAVAAVSKATEALPAEELVNFSLMPEGGEAAGNDSTEPPNYRNKVGAWHRTEARDLAWHGGMGGADSSIGTAGVTVLGGPGL